MPETSAPAILALPAGITVEVRIVRWWWTRQADQSWAADVEVPDHGLVCGVPGDWLHRTTVSDERVEVPKNRRGRVSIDRSTTLGERLARVHERDQRAR